MIWANSPWVRSYAALLHAEFGPTLYFYNMHLSAHAWVNDGLMALFFLLVGLEIKREVVSGELSSFGPSGVAGNRGARGIVVPTLICAAFVWHDPERLRGWAVPPPPTSRSRSRRSPSWDAACRRG